MTTAEILQAVENFYEAEYQSAKSTLASDSFRSQEMRERAVDISLSMCYGVAQFVQRIGVDYDDLNIYSEYKEKFKKLLDS